MRLGSVSLWPLRTQTVPPMVWCSLAWATAGAVITGPRTTPWTTSPVRGQGKGEAQGTQWLWSLTLGPGSQAYAVVPRSSSTPPPAWTAPSAYGQRRTACCGGLGPEGWEGWWNGSLGGASWAPLPLPPTRAQELNGGEGLALLPTPCSKAGLWPCSPLQAPAAERCSSGPDLLQQQR